MTEPARPNSPLDDFRECPATTGLAASWIIIFAFMHLVQWGEPVPESIRKAIGPGAILTSTSHRFGDMTWAEVRQGEAWRAVTATFIHYGLLHLGMNLVGLIQLGRLVEPWYGSGPFLAVCLAIGGLGNLVGGLLRMLAAEARIRLGASGLLRLWPGLVDLASAPRARLDASIHTGGGSTILLGLIGLAAVVGWRSRTRIGSYLRDQMVGLLGFTAALGVLLHSLFDNYGHAGGAIVGAAIGFLHRPLVRLADTRRSERPSWTIVATLALVCLGLAILDDRREAPLRLRAAIVERGRLDGAMLDALRTASDAYADVALRGNLSAFDLEAIAFLFRRPIPPAGAPATDPAETTRRLVQALERLRATTAEGWGSTLEGDLADLFALGTDALEEPPSFPSAYAFAVARDAVRKGLEADRARTLERLGATDKAGGS